MSLSSTSDENRLQDVLTELAGTDPLSNRSVAIGTIFHSQGLHCSGKFFAFVRRGEVVVKLPSHRVTELVALGAGLPFDAGRQRPMKEWVVLCPTTDERLRALVIEASVFVTSLAKSNN